MPPTIRVALYVFAAVAVLLRIALMLVDEPRQTSGPLATPALLVDDVPHVRLPRPSSPLFGTVQR